MSHSEVAAMLADIEARSKAAWMGLYGVSEGSSKHAVISNGMERIFIDLTAAFGAERAAEKVQGFYDEAENLKIDKASQA